MATSDHGGSGPGVGTTSGAGAATAPPKVKTIPGPEGVARVGSTKKYWFVKMNVSKAGEKGVPLKSYATSVALGTDVAVEV